MEFIGTSGIDGGHMDLQSRMTHPMSFAEAGEWYRANCEYFAMMVKHDCNVFEVIVSVYDARDMGSVIAEPIAQSVFKPKG